MIRAAIAAAAAAFAMDASTAPVAFVADVSGSATIEGDGRLTFLAELEPGTRVLLGTGARAAITFAATGAEYTAIGPGEFLLSSTDLRAERGAAPSRREVSTVSSAAVVSRVSHMATASLRMRGVRPRDAAPLPSSVLEYPVDTRIASLEPVLRWRAEAGPDARVVLRVEAGREVWSGLGARAMARPAVRLSAGTRYTWTLMTPRGAVAEGRFETLAAEPLATAEKSRRGARTFPGRVLHAIVLQDLGAGQDAREAWEELARERPDLPELARLAR